MSENTQENPQAQRGRPKTRIGTVVSSKMTKTVVVQVERLVRDPRYGNSRVADCRGPVSGVRSTMRTRVANTARSAHPARLEPTQTVATANARTQATRRAGRLFHCRLSHARMVEVLPSRPGDPTLRGCMNRYTPRGAPRQRRRVRRSAAGGGKQGPK